jgi:elongation factor P hydroxylase
MTDSPYSRFLPTVLLWLLVSAGQKEPGTTTQGLSALMGDSRPDSLVFCHAHGAQILEFYRLAIPERLSRALCGGMRKPERVLILRQLFMRR